MRPAVLILFLVIFSIVGAVIASFFIYQDAIICLLTSSDIRETIEMNNETVTGINERFMIESIREEVDIFNRLSAQATQSLEEGDCLSAAETVKVFPALVWLIEVEVFVDSLDRWREMWGSSLNSIENQVAIEDIDCDNGIVTVVNLRDVHIESYNVIVYNQGRYLLNERGISSKGSETFEFGKTLLGDVKVAGSLGNLTIYNCSD